VRFLVDAQLPPALARFLVSLGHEAEHVYELDLASASDRQIWERATASDAVLVTKDEDFITMRALARAPGPPIVWVRLGNTTRRALLTRFASIMPAVLEALERGETVVQVSGDEP
jgi:predicted nuclease of predicted toxin-antitoxin system